jgi:hypothetical protein
LVIYFDFLSKGYHSVKKYPEIELVLDFANEDKIKGLFCIVHSTPL